MQTESIRGPLGRSEKGNNVELLFLLAAVLLLDIAAVLFGADSREHRLTSGR